jgi:hypothetical protein
MDPDLGPVPSFVRGVGYFRQALLGHLCQAPKSYSEEVPFVPEFFSFHLAQFPQGFPAHTLRSCTVSYIFNACCRLNT